MNSATVLPGNASSAVSSLPPTHHTPPTTEDSTTLSEYKSAYAELLHDAKSGKVIGVNMRVTEHAFKYGYWKFSPLNPRTQTEAFKFGYSRPEDMIFAYNNGVCPSWLHEIALLWCPGALEKNKTPLIATIPQHVATINQELKSRGFFPCQPYELPVYSLSDGDANILKIRSATMYTGPMPPPVYIPPMTQVVRQPSEALHYPSGPPNPPYGGPAAPAPQRLNTTGSSDLTSHFHGFPPNTPMTQPFGGQPTVAPYRPTGPSNPPYGGPAAPVPQGLNTTGFSDLTSHFHGFPPNPPMTQPLVGQPTMAPYYPPRPPNPPYGGPTATVRNGLNTTAGRVYTSSGPSTYSPGVLPNPSYTFPGVVPNPPTVPGVSSDISDIDMSDIGDYLLNPSTSLSEILSDSSSTLPGGSGVTSSSTLSEVPSMGSSSTSSTLPDDSEVDSSITLPEVLSVESTPTLPESPLVDSPSTLSEILSVDPSLTLLESPLVDSPSTVTAGPSGPLSPFEVSSDSPATLPNADVSAQVTSGALSPFEAALDLPATPPSAEFSAPGLSPLFDKPSLGVPATELESLWGQSWYEEGPSGMLPVAEATEAADQGSSWGEIFDMNSMEWLDYELSGM